MVDHYLATLETFGRPRLQREAFDKALTAARSPRKQENTWSFSQYRAGGSCLK